MMATSKSTFQKRQKEMKRQEKQRMKAERRAQKKLNKDENTESFVMGLASDMEAPILDEDIRS
jgi:hypothetical protein